jgi:pantetheine-phosphate adenylyltransferase
MDWSWNFIDNLFATAYNKDMKKAIYAGSFDPVTNGHLWVIEQGAKLFDKLFVVLAYNPQKSGYFSVAQRQQLLTKVLGHLPNVEVILLSNDYVAQSAKTLQVDYLLRGIRNTTDYEYEKTIERVNLKINPQLQTIYLTPPAELSEISSSMVKSLVGFPGWQALVQNMVPAPVVSGFLTNLYRSKLQAEWESLAGTNSVSQKWFDIILAKHSESHRYYHHTGHLVSLLTQMSDLPQLDTLTTAALKYAIFFHDIIYNPQSKTNEVDSKNLFSQFAQEINLDGVIATLTEDTILATAHHFQTPKDPRTNYFLDLDLSILGASESEFAQYEQAIRLEYGFVPEDIYQVERAKIMKTLLNPYKTTWGQNKYQTQATSNLSRYKS